MSTKIIQILFFLTFLCGYTYGSNTKNFHIALNENDFSVNNEKGNAYYITSSKYLYGYGNDISEPALPYISINILIGSNEEYRSFTYTNSEQLFLNNVDIVNNVIETPTNSHSNESLTPDISYRGESYPKAMIRYAGTHEANEYRYVSFLIFPFRYDTNKKVLFFETGFTIALTTSEGSSRLPNVKSHNSISEDRIKEIVINGEDLVKLYASTTNASSVLRNVIQYDYIIITNNSLKSAFLKLAEWKTIKGIRTKVITTEEIYSSYPGVTNQQKIKNALKYYYDNCPTMKYALLAGDVNIIPAQMCTVKYLFDEKFCPVDLYYADFNTMNWDSNGNGIYGEVTDVISPYPQIAITRAPVSTSTEAETFVNRIIEYECYPNIEHWSNNLLLCGSILENYYSYNGVTLSDTHYKGEKLYTDYIANYWGGSKISFFDTGTDFPGGASYDFDRENIQTQLSKGYTFVNVDTHGTPRFWFTEGAFYTDSFADTLNNSNHSIITTTACLTNAFDSIPKCLSESFIRNANSGIVAYFGCSREGWYSDTQYNLGTSKKVNGEFYKVLLNGTEKNFGEVVRQTKENIIPYCSDNTTPYRWLLFGLNAIGDPEMPIFTGVPQKFTNVSITFAFGILTINTGVNDCKISVVSANDLGETYYDVREGTNGTYHSLTDEYTICITKPGYVPYIAYCGNDAYLQNQIIRRDYHVFSNQTFAGSDVTTNRPYGPVQIQEGKVKIKSINGVTLKNNFEVKSGATLEISTGVN